MVGVPLWSMMQEAWLEVCCRLRVSEDVSRLVIGGWRVIRSPLREDVEMRLRLEVVSAGVPII